MTKNETVDSTLASQSDDDSFVDIMETEQIPSSDVQDLPPLKLSVTPRHDVVGTGSKMSTTQICATIEAGKLVFGSKRAPVDVVVALDISGSMSGDKLALCKTTLELLVRQLLPQDRFGLVTFSDGATIEIPTVNMTESNKSTALAKIQSLRTRGCTNISAAIGMAAQEVQAIVNPNEVRTIFLLTDGHANRGVSDASGIVDIARGCLNTGKDDGETSPVTMHCFGYGSDHDDKLLIDISDTTAGGTYYFVENDSNVATAFGDALGGILSVVAQNAILNIGVPPEAKDLGVKIEKVHHDNVIQREDESFTVTIGDFYAEESRDVLFDVTLATPKAGMGSTPIPHVWTSLSYTDTLKKIAVVGEHVRCCVARPPNEEVSQPNPHVLVQWLRIHCTNEIDEADRLSNRGDLATARVRIQQCKVLVQSQDDLQSDPMVNQLSRDLDKVMGGLSSYSFYQSHGTKTCKRMRKNHAMQRCSEATVESNVYRGAYRSAVAEKFNTK